MKQHLSSAQAERVLSALKNGDSIEAAKIVARAAGNDADVRLMDALKYVASREGHWDVFESFTSGVVKRSSRRIDLGVGVMKAFRKHYSEWFEF